MEKTNIMLRVLLLSLVVLSTFFSAAAATSITALLWNSNQQTSLTVTEGDSPELYVAVNSDDNFRLDLDIFDSTAQNVVSHITTLNIPSNTRYTQRFPIDTSGLAAGDYIVLMQVNSASGFDLSQVNLHVNARNTAPSIILPSSRTVDEGTTWNFQVQGNDAENDPLTFSMREVPCRTFDISCEIYRLFRGFNPLDYIVFNTQTGQFNFEPTRDIVKHPATMVSFELEFTVSDGSLSNTARLRIQVDDVNRVPQAQNTNLVTDEDTSGSVVLSANDADSEDSVSFSIGTNPTLGTAIISGNRATYTPNVNTNGADSFTFVASDGRGGSTTGRVSVTVNSVNDAPIANDVTASTSEDNPPSTVTLSYIDADNDLAQSCSVSNVQNGASGTCTCSNGVCTVELSPAADSTADVTADYTVNDGTTDSNTAHIILSVTSVNDLPTASAVSATTTEDNSKDITLLGSDVEGIASYNVDSEPSNGQLSPIINDRLTYTPNPNFNGVDTFTFTVTDTDGEVSTPATVTITVTAVNDLPVANTVTVTGSEDIPFPITLSGSDVEGVIASYNRASQPANGDVTITNNIATYTPNADYNGPDSFTYTVTDTDGAVSSAATVTITVTSVNDFPTANDVSVTTTEDHSIDITLSGNDVEGIASHDLVNGPSNGQLSPIVNSLTTYTPNTGFHGIDTFTYTVTDTDGEVSAPATVTVTVTEVIDPNRAPVADDQTKSTSEDTPLPITLTGSDSDGDAITFRIIEEPLNGVRSGTLPNLIYTPNANYYGDDKIVFAAVDSHGEESLPASVIISVTSVNDIPIANDITVTISEDSSTEIILSGSDVEGIASYNRVSQPSNGVVTITNNIASYAPNANFVGTDTFTFTVTDTDGDVSAPAKVTIIVIPVNDLPTANTLTATTPEDEPVEIVLSGSDVEGIDSFNLASQPANGVATLDINTATYTPNTGFHGIDTFTYTVTDTDGAVSAPATVTVIVTEVVQRNLYFDEVELNGQTLNVGDTLIVSQGDLLRIRANVGNNGTVSVSDVFVEVSIPDLSLGSTSISEALPASTTSRKQFSLELPGNVNPGTYQVRLRLAGDLVEDLLFTFNIQVSEPRNLPPTAFDQDLNVEQNVPRSISLTGNDSDGSVVDFRIVNDVSNGLLRNGDNYLYRPNRDYVGPDSFTFVAIDNDGAESAPATVTLTIIPTEIENIPPNAGNDMVNTLQDEPLPITLFGNDSDGTIVGYTVTSQPASGTLSGADRERVYTPNPGFTGSDSFKFTVTDNDGAVSAEATVAISVNPLPTVNEIPIANGQTIATDENTEVEFTLTGFDPDGVIVDWRITRQPFNGAVSGIAPNLTYTPAPDFSGRDSFTFVAVDNDGAESETATVLINVESLNQAPTALSQTVRTTQGNTVSITLRGEDIDGTIADYSIISTLSNGELSGNIPNLVYTPHPDFTGQESFTFIVTDNDGAQSSPSRVTIIVDPTPNSAPVLNPIGNWVVQEGQMIALYVSATDADNDQLTYRAENLPTGAEFVDQTFAWVPEFNQQGIYSVTFIVSDGTLEDRETIQVEVGNVNLQPRIASAPGRIARVGEEYTYQVRVVDDNSLTYRLREAPEGMTISSTGLISWTPTREGQARVSVEVFDGYELLLQEFTVDTRQEYTNLRVASAQLSGEFATPGEHLLLHMTLDNNGDRDLDDMKVTATIYELGVRRSSGEFDLEAGESVHENLAVEIPYYTEPGQYMIKVVVGNNEYHDVVYRMVTIV